MCGLESCFGVFYSNCISDLSPAAAAPPRAFFFFLLLFKPPYFQKARFFTRSSLWGEVAPLGASS